MKSYQFEIHKTQWLIYQINNLIYFHLEAINLIHKMKENISVLFNYEISFTFL